MFAQAPVPSPIAAGIPRDQTCENECAIKAEGVKAYLEVVVVVVVDGAWRLDWDGGYLNSGANGSSETVDLYLTQRYAVEILIT